MGKGYNKRKSNLRVSPKLLLIICEGTQTEGKYFNHYKKRNSGLKIIIPNTNRTDPLSLVKFAKSQARRYQLDFSDGDTIWCVFDVDNHSNPQIKSAIKEAGNEVKLIISNPSFELWYLLHYKTHLTKISNNELMQKLKAHLPNYEKNQSFFEELLDKRNSAINNSDCLEKFHNKNETELLSTDSNPYTKVHELVKYLLDI